MPVSVWRVVAGLACCGLASVTRAEDFFLKTRPPTADQYLYAGSQWADFDGGLQRSTLVIAGTWIQPNDLEFGIETSVAHQTGRGESIDDVGDTTLRIAKGFRNKGIFKFISVEYAQVFATAPDELTSGIERYAAVRTLSGPTRAQLRADLELFEHRDLPGESRGSTSIVATLGMHSQWIQWHFGANARVTGRRGDRARTSGEVIAMYTRLNGDAFYATVGTDRSQAIDAAYASIGYEVRFSL